MSKPLRIAIASGKGGADKTNVKERLPSELLQGGRRHGLEELVVISGKRGTGKTSIVASFFALAEQPGVADYDVDAADLYLVLSTDMQMRATLSSANLETHCMSP